MRMTASETSSSAQLFLKWKKTGRYTSPSLPSLPAGPTFRQRPPIWHLLLPSALGWVLILHFHWKRGAVDTQDSLHQKIQKVSYHNLKEEAREYRNGRSGIGQGTLKYKKRFNGTTYYVEEILSGREELRFKIMYKEKTSPATSTARGLAHTSAPEGAPTANKVSSDDIVPETKDVGNISISKTSVGQKTEREGGQVSRPHPASDRR